MRRLLLGSVLVAVAALPLPLAAQHGVAVRAAARPAPRMAGSVARRMPGPRPVVAGGVRGIGAQQFGTAFVGGARFHHRHHHFFFTSGCFGNPFCSGFYYPYYPYAYYPYLSYPPLFGYDTQYQQPQAYPAVQPVYDDSTLRGEVGRLADEMEQMRRDWYSRPAPQAAQPARPSLEQPTVLVFHDGHRSEVRNYGIVGQTLWVFNEQHARKYPLSDLDLDATRAANEQRGVEFALPSR